MISANEQQLPARVQDSSAKPYLPAGERTLGVPHFSGLFRGSTQGNANVPKQGALVVAANHGSHLDPPILGHALGRPVAFMAKAELFDVPLLGRLIRALGRIPSAGVPATGMRSAQQRPRSRPAGRRGCFSTALDRPMDG